MLAQNRRQALPARLLEHVPDLNKRGDNCGAVLAFSPAALRPHNLRPRLVVQCPDQVLPVVSSALLRLIQQPAPAALVRLAVLLPYFGQILLARVHVHLSEVPCPTPVWVTFLRDPTEIFWVTF